MCIVHCIAKLKIIKTSLFFDPCISISNKLILVFSYIALRVYCFYVISIFHFYCTVMYVDVRLSHPNKDYLLTYLLRSTISQKRLDGLAFHAIENEAAKQLNTDDLLDSFANNKARHCKLMA